MITRMVTNSLALARSGPDQTSRARRISERINTIRDHKAQPETGITELANRRLQPLGHLSELPLSRA